MSETNEPLNMLSTESWEYSRNYAALFGEIPNSFSTAVRSLIIDQNKYNGTLSRGTLFLTRRLMRGKSLKAPFYFAVKALKPEVLENKNFLTDDDLLNIFRPDALAALFAIIYVYKKAKKYCNPTEWEFIAPHLHKELTCAGLVGVALNNVGLSNALLTYGARYLALLTFLKHSPKHFQEYRRELKAQKTFFSVAKEMEYFGCTTPQIASIFIQTFGYGIPFANNYVTALSNEKILEQTFPDSSPFKVTELWTKSLIETGAEPKIAHDTKFYPPNGEALKVLIERAKNIPVYWLDKTSDDISPQLTPQICAADSTPSQETIPEEIKESMTSEEISKLETDQEL